MTQDGAGLLMDGLNCMTRATLIEKRALFASFKPLAVLMLLQQCTMLELGMVSKAITKPQDILLEWQQQRAVGSDEFHYWI
jgi:hypothetical protein